MSSADRAAVPFEQHVLDEMGDAALVGALVAGAARQPDPDADRPHLCHALGEDAKPVTQNVSDDR